jgi:hypothetical protein
MLVMMLPVNPMQANRTWPNPIIFQNSANGNVSPDPQKDTTLNNLDEYMVFDHNKCPELCTMAAQQKYEQYMHQLEMPYWASIDQNSRPAGECCIGNETSSSMLAFQGTMKIYGSGGQELQNIQGSGHLGHSYVGVASVREGRGLLTAPGLPQTVRQV